MRDINLLTIHCSATPNGRWTTTADIDAWHRERGFRRRADAAARQNSSLSAIGYHYVIYTNGAVATGRMPDEVGAHAVEQRANWRGIGLCVIGTDQFSAEQWDCLAAEVVFLCAAFSIPRRFANAGNGYTGVCGHRDLGARKACPGFSVADWLKSGMQPPAGQIYTPGAA